MICDAYSDYLSAKELLDDAGMTYTVKSREGVEIMKAHSAAPIKADTWRRVMIGR